MDYGKLDDKSIGEDTLFRIKGRRHDNEYFLVTAEKIASVFTNVGYFIWFLAAVLLFIGVTGVVNFPGIKVPRAIILFVIGLMLIYMADWIAIFTRFVVRLTLATENICRMMSDNDSGEIVAKSDSEY